MTHLERDLPVAEDWFEVMDVGDGITQITEPHVEPLIRSNAWLIRGRDLDVLVDSGLGILPLSDVLEATARHPLIAVATHSHFDHVGGMREFERRAIHPLEAADLGEGADAPTLVTAALLADLGETLDEPWRPSGDYLITALPDEDFDPAHYRPPPCTATEVIEDGDVLDLGDRGFEVLHLPGHSPGSIGLWSARDGIFISGDAVYRDQPILDHLPGSNVEDYRETMRRIRELPVRIVHAGHEASFGRQELVMIVDRYLDGT